MSTQNDQFTTQTESYLERRDMLLKDVDKSVITRAWFTLSHLLLDEGAKVVDMGCDDGAMTYAMAAMNPKLKFTGLDKSKRQINKAREKYSLHNLEFVIADSTTEIFEHESIDAVINSYVLHEVYSGSRYNERIVSDTLRKHFKMLKKGGVMFIRDFARPPPGEYVLIEMPDIESTGNTLATLSEPDLLVWYAEHARPRSDPGTGGFFIEELPPRFPRTRLFRLPYKWAYEFIMRKDNRAHWELALPTEFTFFTARDFMKELRVLDARVQYAGPHWEEDITEKKFEGSFKLYDDNGNLIGHPPTSFIAVAYKMAERKSLYIEERRPSNTAENSLKINALRDEKTGRIVDVVSRGLSAAEIIPYRLDEENRLKLFLHDGVARSIANAVPRNGVNLDGRTWSGHMIEPVSVDADIIVEMDTPDVKKSARFCRDYLGLIPRESAIIEKGPDYYPSPDYIDEKILTCYLNVEQPRGAVIPKNFIGSAERFHAKGVVREMDAQQVLNAITVGMIPNARLEMQILALFTHLKIQAENWTSKNVAFQAGAITKDKSLAKLMKQYEGQMNRFKEVKGSAGQLRPVHSTFVEEGQARGATTGLSSQDIDFVVFDDKTINTAVVLPMCKDLKDDVHAGFFLDQLPVPQMHQPGSLTMSAPSFNLPRSVTNLQQAKKYLAEQFGVFPQMVFKVGESYYSHIGVTPQKIHPFGVAVPPKFFEDRKMETMPLYQVLLIRQKVNMIPDLNMNIVAARSYKMLGQDQSFSAKLQAKPILNERFGQSRPDFSIPMTYHQAPTISTSSTSKPTITAPVVPVLAPTAPAQSTATMAQAPKPQAFHAETLAPQPPTPEPISETPVTVTALRAPIAAMVPVVAPSPQPAPQPAAAPREAPSIQSGELRSEFEQELDEFLDDLDVVENYKPGLDR